MEVLEERVHLDGSVPPQFPGAPIALPGGAWTQTPFFGSPVFADLNGDGKNELLVEAAGGKMIAYGTDASGQLVKFQEYRTTPLPNGKQANFKSTPVVVRVPGVGMVIVAALGHDEGAVDTPNALEDGRVYAFNAVTGQVLPGWPQSTAYPGPGITNDGVTGALTVGYLEPSGMPDVVVNASSTLVIAFRMDGSRLWTFSNDESVEPGSVVADLNDDGKPEVVLASGMSPGVFYPTGGYITILNGADGSLLRRIHTDEAFFGGPVVADLFGDGRKEIIGATSPYIADLKSLTPAQRAAARAAGNRIYAYFPDGRPVPGWPYHTTADDSQARQTWKEPIAADLYGDGRNEVIALDRSGVLHVVLPNGQAAPGFAGGLQVNPAYPYNNNVINDAFSTPIVADVDGDGRQDIVVARAFYLAAYTNTGRLIWSTTTTTAPGTPVPNAVESAAAYGTFDPNGPPALAFVSMAAVRPGPPQAVQVFRLPASPVAPSWPMLRRDPTGQAIARSSTAELAALTKIYKAIWGRPPQQPEVDYYLPWFTSGKITHVDFAAKLAGVQPGLSRFPGLLNVSDADTRAKVTALYQSLGIATVPPDSMAAILFDAHRGRSYRDVAVQVAGTGGNYAASSPQASWAHSLLTDIFRVAPGPAAVADLVGKLDSGWLYGDVVKWLLNHVEVRKGFVARQVGLLLGRAATASDIAYLVNYTRREDVVVALVSSNEFYAKSGGTPAGYVTHAYQKLINLTPPAATVNQFAGWLANGTVNRATIAKMLVSGQTGALYLSNFVVENMFQYVPDPSKGNLRVRLGRTGPPDNPNPSSVATYTNQLVRGQVTDEIVLASMMTSGSYRASANYLRGVFVAPGIRA